MLLLFFPGAWVIAGRVKFKVDSRDGGHAAMRQRIRAHADFSGYAPVALLLLVEKESIGPRWLATAMGATLRPGDPGWRRRRPRF